MNTFLHIALYSAGSKQMSAFDPLNLFTIVKKLKELYKVTRSF